MESTRTVPQAARTRADPAEQTARTRILAASDRAGQASDDAPGVEELVVGRYLLLERLGSGGFGTVWRARDELLHREVAVKRVWLGPDGDSERATREALASARLAHPAIVALYEACTVDDAFYLISELVDGCTLARLIAEDAIDDEEILRIASALADALDHAHARGVIHRDIKPQNVLVPHPGEQRAAPASAPAKLTDFGGARLADEDALTRTGDVLGTLAYMAPEQSEGREVTEQADLYALALVTYEALTGVNPVRGATPAATARRIGTRLEPLRRHRRDLSHELAGAIDRALDPAPRQRGSLAELRAALEQARDAAPVRTRRWLRPRERAVEPLAEPSTPDAPLPRRPPLVSRPAPAAEHAFDAPDVEHAQHVGHAAQHAQQVEHAQDVEARRRGVALPRFAWLACALALIVWELIAGRAGVALLVLAACAPLVVLPSERRSRRVGVGWLACALAPVLGLAGLAGAFPALAGQASRWRDRLALAALGYWWLLLAESLLDRRLWLGQPAGTPPRQVWDGSLTATASHVVSPRLTLAVALGALLWGLGAAVLPWLVRGRAAALDLVATVVWSAALAAAAPIVDAGLAGHGAHPSPRGAILGALLGGVLAVAARALRGPV